MLFILRATFWIAAVAAFTPAGFHMTDSHLTDELRSWADSLAAEHVEAPSAGADFCTDHPEACRVGEEIGVLVDVIGAVANDRVERLTSENTAD